MWQGIAMALITPVFGWCLWLFAFKPDVPEVRKLREGATLSKAPIGAGGSLSVG